MLYPNKMNEILDLIEENLTGEISYEMLAKHMALSIYEFRRIFTFVIGVSISEYVRLRKLSCAAIDLQMTNNSIAEIANKYGYDSSSSFSRAFREMQKMSPTEARADGAQLVFYPRMSFSVCLTGGDEIPFRMVRRKSMKLCGYSGISRETESGCCEDIWEAFFDRGIHDRLIDKGYYPDDAMEYAAYEDYDEVSVQCTIGSLLDSDAPIPEGMDARIIPEALWGVFTVTGNTSEQINHAYSTILPEWLSCSGYERDPAVCNLEAYPVDGTEDSSQTVWEIWYPLRKKDKK